MHDVFAIDNALVDILLQIDDAALRKLKLEKGVCNYPSDAELQEIRDHVNNGEHHVTPGGSAANMAVLLGQLGANVVFCDAVGNDDHGDLYERDFKEHGVTPRLARSKEHTGTAITFITPDAERTFAVHLGAALTFTVDDLPEEDVKQSTIVYVSSYLLEDPNLRAAAMRAMELAKEAGNIVAIDLSDPALVKRIPDVMRDVVQKHVDIVFANDDEAKAYTGKSPEEAILILAEHADIAIVKIGAEGSLIKKGNKIIKVAAHKVKAVDTTGAGDAYAAGFLYAYLQDKPLSVCGDLGSLLAAKVIAQVGARLQEIPEEEIQTLLATPH